MSRPFSGAVLVGGRSRRFGRDKARYLWRGRSLLEHVLMSLGDAEERFLVGDRPYPEFGLATYPDPEPGVGPLAGVEAALAHARHRLVAVAACDLPRLRPEFWAYLLAAMGEAPAVASAGPDGEVEPLAAVYTRRLLPELTRARARGVRSLRAFWAGLGGRVLPFAATARLFGPEIFLNANRPEDLQNA